MASEHLQKMQLRFLPYHQVTINLTQGIVPKQPELQELQSMNVLVTYFSPSSDLFCCSALARAMAPVEVRPLW